MDCDAVRYFLVKRSLSTRTRGRQRRRQDRELPIELPECFSAANNTPAPPAHSASIAFPSLSSLGSETKRPVQRVMLATEHELLVQLRWARAAYRPCTRRSALRRRREKSRFSIWRVIDTSRGGISCPFW